MRQLTLLAVWMIHTAVAFDFHSRGPTNTWIQRIVSMKTRKKDLGDVERHSEWANHSDKKDHCLSRRLVLASAVASLGCWTPPALARGVSPDQAFTNLLSAREELATAAKNYLVKGDYRGMSEFLETASNINSYEENAQALLESKRLDVESKKEIGTIRRYGVGADVIIMYGGLRNELNQDPPDSSQVKLYWTRALDSLDEVIVICRNNGL